MYYTTCYTCGITALDLTNFRNPTTGLHPYVVPYVMASCPSLPGCFSQGRTFDEAVENITEAIGAYTECLAKERTEGDVSLRVVEVSVR